MSEEPRLDKNGFFIGQVNDLEDFKRCSPFRQSQLMSAIKGVMDTYRVGLSKAEERLETAARAVELEKQSLAHEREALAKFMAIWIDYSQVVARACAISIETACEVANRDSDESPEGENAERSNA